MRLIETKSKKAKGVTAAGLVALLQGTEGIFFTLLGLFFIASAFSSPEFAAGELAVKELICLLLLSVIFAKHIKSAIESLKTSKGRTFAVSGMITGMGNMVYIIGIALAGTSYGVILTALYPVFSMLFMRMIFKDRQSKLVWVGAGTAVLGGLLFISLPAMLNPEEIDGKKIAGMLLGLLAACFWAFEGIFMKKGNDAKGTHLEAQGVVLVRTTFSALITLIVLMPVMSIPAFNHSGHISFYWFGQMFHRYETMLIVVAVAVSVAVLRLIHISAIKAIGPKMTAIIDANNFLVPSFFSIFLAYAGLEFLDGGALFDPIVWWAWFLVIFILLGVLIVVTFEGNDQRKKMREKNK